MLNVHVQRCGQPDVPTVPVIPAQLPIRAEGDDFAVPHLSDRDYLPAEAEGVRGGEQGVAGFGDQQRAAVTSQYHSRHTHRGNGQRPRTLQLPYRRGDRCGELGEVASSAPDELILDEVGDDFGVHISHDSVARRSKLCA